jgi:hypothetical protein
MNVFAMNLATGRVDDRYLQILIVAQAVFAKVLCKLFAMTDRVGVGVEIDSDPVSERNAIFHIEKEFLHLPHLELLQQWKSSTRDDYRPCSSIRWTGFRSAMGGRNRVSTPKCPQACERAAIFRP